MPITTAICNSAKQGFLSGVHLPSHTYKFALIKSTYTGTYGSGTMAYADFSGDEVANGNGYTTGGYTLTNMTFSSASGTGSIDWDNASWSNSTISAVGGVIYNASIAASSALAVFSFGGTISSTNGTFTVTIPDAGTGVIRFA